ncbi:unnamed protein product [Protopolystoma xenopodis]|uniref:Uncharacterized protein n=1 Tax=Protopolystoma xenopodis TaxID=117903 RepID=A0A3S5C0X4_9PLAT|nr:unnamed protein product [Protopolystoma xenopodis]
MFARMVRTKALHVFTAIEGDYRANSVNKNAPIDSWTRGMRRRLLLKSAFESLQQIPPLEREVGSRMMYALRKD